MANWGIVAACGPNDAEIARVGDLLESVFHFEPDTRWVALIDSSEIDRDLASRFPKPAGVTIQSIRNPKSGWADGQWGSLCTGILGAYDWISRETDAQFVAKFDSDALVIAPFAAKIMRAMMVDPQASIFGAYRFDPNGGRRDWSGMAGFVRRLNRFALFQHVPKRFGRRFPFAVSRRTAGMRRHISHAVANGYEFGEHVSGGAYAVTRSLLDRMRNRDYFAERDVWADSQMSEDVMMGIYARACGMRLTGHSADGDVFGVKHVGIPDTPEQLIERGYSIIHSIKSDPRFTEDEIRSFFSNHRAGVPSVAFARPSFPAIATPARKVASSSPAATGFDGDELDELALGY